MNIFQRIWKAIINKPYDIKEEADKIYIQKEIKEMIAEYLQTNLDRSNSLVMIWRYDDDYVGFNSRGMDNDEVLAVLDKAHFNLHVKGISIRD